MGHPEESKAINPNGRNPLERFFNCVNRMVEGPVVWFRGNFKENPT